MADINGKLLPHQKLDDKPPFFWLFYAFISRMHQKTLRLSLLCCKD